MAGLLQNTWTGNQFNIPFAPQPVWNEREQPQEQAQGIFAPPRPLLYQNMQQSDNDPYGGQQPSQDYGFGFDPNQMYGDPNSAFGKGVNFMATANVPGKGLLDIAKSGKISLPFGLGDYDAGAAMGSPGGWLGPSQEDSAYGAQQRAYGLMNDMGMTGNNQYNMWNMLRGASYNPAQPGGNTATPVSSNAAISQAIRETQNDYDDNDGGWGGGASDSGGGFGGQSGNANRDNVGGW